MDVTLARENQTNFEEYLSSNPHLNPGLDLTVTVLTTGFWPSYKSFDLNLPSDMVCILHLHRYFYLLSCSSPCSVSVILKMVLFFCYWISQLRCQEIFKEFYETKTKHRKLAWMYSLGTCNIVGKFDLKPIEMVVTTYQVCFFHLIQ